MFDSSAPYITYNNSIKKSALWIKRNKTLCKMSCSKTQLISVWQFFKPTKPRTLSARLFFGEQNNKTAKKKWHGQPIYSIYKTKYRHQWAPNRLIQIFKAYPQLPVYNFQILALMTKWTAAVLVGLLKNNCGYMKSYNFVEKLQFRLFLAGSLCFNGFQRHILFDL